MCARSSMDRASDYGSEGYRFKSCRAHHNPAPRSHRSELQPLLSGTSTDPYCRTLPTSARDVLETLWMEQSLSPWFRDTRCKPLSCTIICSADRPLEDSDCARSSLEPSNPHDFIFPRSLLNIAPNLQHLRSGDIVDEQLRRLTCFYALPPDPTHSDMTRRHA